MIQASDLRIGNMINEAYLGNVSVYSVSTGEFNTIEVSAIHNQIYTISEDNANPIPLTKEILEKCGFKVNKLGNFFKRVAAKNEGYKPEVHLGDYFDEKGFCYLVGANIHITTVHELQNLYKALTNEELTITL
jgi:hypothetical protein